MLVLRRGLNVVGNIASLDAWEQIFLDMAAKSRVIRLVLAVHRAARAIGLSHVFVASYGLLHFLLARMPSYTPEMLAVAYFKNEVKHIDEFDSIMGERKPARVAWTVKQAQSVLALLSALAHVGDVWRIMRVFRRFERKLNFMPACRVASCLFLYARYRNWLVRHRVRAVVVTSDYSPESVALSCAAAALGIKHIYIPHALPATDKAISDLRTLLSYEAYVLDSMAMRDRFSVRAPLSGVITYRGVRGEDRPLQRERLDASHLRIGLFLSSPTHMQGLVDAITGLAHFAPAHILVRGHPVEFANPDFSGVAKLASNVTISKGTTLLQDAEACDLVIAGNTTAFLEVLKYGIPCVYLSTLDYVTPDYNGFVTDKLVPEIASTATMNIGSIKAFFHPAWEERMRYFDASYGRNRNDLLQEVRRTMLAFLA